MAERLIDD